MFRSVRLALGDKKSRTTFDMRVGSGKPAHLGPTKAPYRNLKALTSKDRHLVPEVLISGLATRFRPDAFAVFVEGGRDTDEGVPRTAVTPGASSVERDLSDVEHDILLHLFRIAPHRAVFLGLHGYDGKLPEVSVEAAGNWCRRARGLLESLARVPEPDLSPERRLDRLVLQLALESELFSLEDWPTWGLEPLAYAFPIQLSEYTNRAYAPASVRAASIIRQLEATPRFLRTGVRRLRDPLPEPFVRPGIDAFAQMPEHLREGEAFASEALPDQRDEVRRVRQEAEAAVLEFQERLKEAMQRTTPQFALGPKRFQKLLWVTEGLTTPWRALLEQGWADLRRNQARLAERAHAIRPTATVKEVVFEMQSDHPSSEGLLSAARECVGELREFVVKRGFVQSPDDVGCAVEESPPADRAFAFASLRSPGPFEQGAAWAAYRITTVDPDWPRDRQEQWLRRFHRAALRIVTAHEVYPGHYLQHQWFRRTAKTTTQRALGSGSFFEGWAHYAEQLVIEQGYGETNLTTEIAQLQEALLRDCRLIASIAMHAKRMSLDGATALFEREAHLDPFPASREALRGTFGPTYFRYALGKLAILRTREEFFQRSPTSTIREFHDRLLSLPAPPVGMLPDLMRG